MVAPEAPGPVVMTMDGLFGQCPSAGFHGLFTLGQGLGHVGVGDSLRLGDKADDEVGIGSTLASGFLGPAVHPLVQHRGNIAGTGQGPSGDEGREGGTTADPVGASRVSGVAANCCSLAGPLSLVSTYVTPDDTAMSRTAAAAICQLRREGAGA